LYCPPKEAQPPKFSAHVYWGQTAICMRIPLGTKVGLSLGDIVLDGDPAPPPRKGHTPHPIFSPRVLWRNGWEDEDATWYGSTSRPRPHCVRQGPSSPNERGTAAPPLFGPCLLWPRSTISAAAELLFIHSINWCITAVIDVFNVCLPV